MSTKKFALGILACGSLQACASVPKLPPDSQLPIKQILVYSVCDLRSAFLKLEEEKYTGFNAKKWFINVTITPKVNAERSIFAGTTGKSTTVPGKRYFNTYALGAAPGATANAKGHSDGSITYVLHSAALLDPVKYPLDCDQDFKAKSELTRGLDVKGWLLRAVRAGDEGIGEMSSIDKPTYTAQIYAKYNGGGSFTYSFPFGTAFAGASAVYDRDETLSITLTPDQTKKTIVVQTLPLGGVFGNPPPAVVTTVIGSDPASRLDDIQLEQSLRNLQVQINN